MCPCLLRGALQAMTCVPVLPAQAQASREGESRNAVGEDPIRAPESAAAPATVSGEPPCADHWTRIVSGKGKGPATTRKPGDEPERKKRRAPSGGRQEACHMNLHFAGRDLSVGCCPAIRLPSGASRP